MGKLADRLKEKSFELRLKQEMASLEIAESIHDEMEKQGISQADLAARLKKSAAWISKVLHGGRNLELFTAVEFADALNCNVGFTLVHRHAVRWDVDLSAVSLPSAVLMPIPFEERPLFTVVEGSAKLAESPPLAA